ncbi:MAG: ATP-binding protein [Bdellovibrionota bacterium]
MQRKSPASVAGTHQNVSFLLGGGEMHQRTREFDWGATPVGPIDAWPQSLRTVVRIMLDSRYAMWLGWGPEFTFFYNDAYAKMTLGPKHPWALGRSAKEVWSEIWGDIGPRAESVMQTGEATWDEGLLLFLERQGFPEETYHTFSYSPVPDDYGNIGGMLCVVTEDTERTIGERRLQTLRELAARTTDEASSVEGACRVAAQILGGNPRDVAFALLYLLDAGGGKARLAGATGVSPGLPISPEETPLEGDRSPWPFSEVVVTGRPIEVRRFPKDVGQLPSGAWSEPASAAMVLPLARPGQVQVAGFAVIGLSPRRPLDDHYRGFLELLSVQIAISIANAGAYEEERKRAEALAELDRSKTRFFSNVSHEFRTPLTLMLSPLEELLGRSFSELPPVVREQLEIVNRNGLRLLRLVNSLLDFSRIEAGRVRASYSLTDLGTYTAELASNFRSACERAGLKLRVESPPTTEPVYVDRLMWEKIVLNLLSNAFKFTFRGEITVSLTVGETDVELAVRDTGTGIPPEEMDHLFDRFHRVENARGRTHEGSGIGLALVQELAKLHHGTVAAESALGSGSTFRVKIPVGMDHLPPDQVRSTDTLPRESGSQQIVEEALRWLPEAQDIETTQRESRYVEPDETSGTPSILHEARPKVLIVDDNSDMRLYMGRLLSDHYRVQTAADGAEGLAAALHDPPDLVLSDVMMPRLDGFELLKALRAETVTADIPIILLSARAGEESRVEGVDAGADDYLVKPFSARELIARVRSHLTMARIRRETNVTLRENEERLRMALTAAKMVAWHYEPSSGTLQTSENSAEVLGVSASALVRIEDGFAMLHPDDVERHRKTVLDTVAAGGSYVTQYRFIRPSDGKIIWLEERGHAVPDGSGQTVRLVGVVMDITERQRAVEELNEAHQFLHSSLDALSAHIAVLDEQGEILAVNQAWQTFADENSTAGVSFGVGANYIEVCEKSSNECVDSELVSAALRDVLEGKTTQFQFEYPCHSPTEQRWFTMRITRFKSSSPVRLVVSHENITERRLAEERSRESELRFRQLADAMPQLVWVASSSGEIYYYNSRVAEYGGVERTAVGWDWRPALHKDDLERTQAAWQNAVDDLKPYQCEHRLQIADGSYRWHLSRAMPVPAGPEGEIFWYGTATDIHDRKIAEEANDRLLDGLREADRRKDEFLATLAHELRNPLAPIRNSLELLRKSGAGNTDAGRIHEILERQANHMVRLVDDLLELSRITRGTIELRPESIEVGAVIQNALETCRPNIDTGEHQVEVDLPPSPLFIEGDPIRISQVIANLLNNSAKYTDRGGRITVRAETRGGEAIITVSDNGRGISSESLPRIFDMFTQIDRDHKHSQGGLGVGLALVKSIVQMHRGRVEARSEGLGKGSEFVLYLPLSETQLVDKSANGAVVPSSGAGMRRVLVVDDNHDAALTLSMLLETFGADVRTANDGLHALELVDSFRPSLILLDLGMPGMSGYEVAERIRSKTDTAGIVIVALTGWGQEEDRRRTKEAGFNHHLVKPVDFAELSALLESDNPSFTSTASSFAKH